MSKYDDLKAAIAEAEADSAKFYEKGNSAAGTRLRASMMKVKNLANDVRKEVIEKKNAN